MKRNRTNNSDIDEESYSLDMFPPGSKETKKESNLSDESDYWAGVVHPNEFDNKSENEYNIFSKYPRIIDILDQDMKEQSEERWNDRIKYYKTDRIHRTF